MAQARRASDECIYMLLGELIEHGPTEDIFLRPKRKETEMYIEGRTASVARSRRPLRGTRVARRGAQG